MPKDKENRPITWRFTPDPGIAPESVPDSATPCPECGSRKVVPVFIRTLWGPATPEERELADKKLAILLQTYVTADYGSASGNRDASECLSCGYRWSDRPRPPDDAPFAPGPDDYWKYWKPRK